MDPVCNNVGERSRTETYHPVSLLFVVSKFYENLLITCLLITSRNKSFFLIFENNFCSSWSAAEFWAVVADMIARVLNRPGTVLDVVLHISNSFESFALLDKLKSCRISDQVFSLVSSLFFIFCYLSYIDTFVHYLIRLCVIDMFVWTKMFQQWHIYTVLEKWLVTSAYTEIIFYNISEAIS